ncbi:hypothetical protein JCM10207_007969 [Rhodosporidiobolus poonsookiae]
MRSTSAFLALLALFTPTTLVTGAAIAPRQYVNQLGVGWGRGGEEPGNIYLSTSDWSCGPYPVKISGDHAPFRVDAIAYPYSVSNQTVLAPLVSNWQVNSFEWLPTFPKKTEFVLRITDSQDSTAYSVKKTVKDGDADRWLCEESSARKRGFERVIDIFLYVFCGVCIFLTVVGIRRRSHARIKRARISARWSVNG